MFDIDHECGHSTGHESRLDRKLTGGQTFGSEDYSREELVAEFAAAFLCAETGISNERVSTNHLAYIQGWMRALKNDKTMLVSAAQKAQRAADLILDRAAGA
jgi:antirestriction protein ArdC